MTSAQDVHLVDGALHVQALHATRSERAKPLLRRAPAKRYRTRNHLTPLAGISPDGPAVSLGVTLNTSLFAPSVLSFAVTRGDESPATAAGFHGLCVQLYIGRPLAKQTPHTCAKEHPSFLHISFSLLNL